MHHGTMTVVRINAITVDPGFKERLAERFAQRSDAVGHAEGFEGFELLRPTDGRTPHLAGRHPLEDEKSFRAWTVSPAFAHGHRGAKTSSGEGAGPPIVSNSELWSCEAALRVSG